MLDLETSHEEWIEASNKFKNGKMTLGQISESGLMRAEWWIRYGGAVYPQGTAQERIERAILRLEGFRDSDRKRLYKDD
jgi:hypothetical protein